MRSNLFAFPQKKRTRQFGTFRFGCKNSPTQSTWNRIGELTFSQQPSDIATIIAFKEPVPMFHLNIISYIIHLTSFIACSPTVARRGMNRIAIWLLKNSSSCFIISLRLSPNSELCSPEYLSFMNNHEEGFEN